MKLSILYFKLLFASTKRNVPALFFTLIFPPLMLLLFANHWKNSNPLGAVVIFFNYSVQTVALMLLGMGVTQEKNSDWAKYLRSLPVGLKPMIFGRLLHTLTLSSINLVSLATIAIFILGLPLNFSNFGVLALVALLGGIPMALLGMTIGYIANPDSSRSIFTLLNLLLLFGSFSLPNEGVFKYLREFVPSYQWAKISLIYLEQNTISMSPVFWLCGLSCFLIFAFQRTYSINLKSN